MSKMSAQIQQHERKIQERRDLIAFYLQGYYFQSSDIKSAQKLVAELHTALEEWHALNEAAANEEHTEKQL